MKLTTYSSDSAPRGFIRIPDRAVWTVDIETVAEPAAAYVLTLRVGLINGPLLATISPHFATEAEALAELDRIAALIEGTSPAPAQAWIKGAPPKDGQWYAAIDFDGDPTVVRYDSGTNDVVPWQTATHFRYANDPAHHLPTPIQPPKES